MSGGLAIESALPPDMDPIMEVMREAFDPAFGEAWNANQCLGILGLPGVWMLLARLDGIAAGFALSRVVVDEAELLLLGVRPLFRRRGVGSALLDQVKTQAGMRGARRLHLEVRDGNPALELYRARGFGQVGSRPGYYRGEDGKSFDALSLSISINNNTAVED